MDTVTVKIDGMACGMCEAHVCDAIRKAVPDAKKVKASRTRREATFLTEGPVDVAKLEKTIADTGYTFRSAKAEPQKKRGLFG